LGVLFGRSAPILRFNPQAFRVLTRLSAAWAQATFDPTKNNNRQRCSNRLDWNQQTSLPGNNRHQHFNIMNYKPVGGAQATIKVPANCTSVTLYATSQAAYQQQIMVSGGPLLGMATFQSPGRTGTNATETWSMTCDSSYYNKGSNTAVANITGLSAGDEFYAWFNYWGTNGQASSTKVEANTSSMGIDNAIPVQVFSADDDGSDTDYNDVQLYCVFMP